MKHKHLKIINLQRVFLIHSRVKQLIKVRKSLILNTKSVELSNLDKKENSQVINNIKDIKLLNKSNVPISVGLILSKTLSKLNKNQTTESSTHTNETQMNKVTHKRSYLKDNQN